MKESWDALVSLLTEMVDLYRGVLNLSRNKQEVLIEVNPPELEKITKQEEFLILQIGKLESKRGKLLKGIAADCGVKPEELTLSKLQELAEPAMADRLEAVAGEFDQTMIELASVNQLNTELIQRALGFINYNLNVLSQTTTGPTYASQGQTGQANIRKIIDRKV